MLRRVKFLDGLQVRTVSVLLAALTTPWLFLLPTATASGWLGELLILIGGLAGRRFAGGPRRLAGDGSLTF